MLNYKGLKAELEHLRVSEAQIDQQIDALIEQRPRIIEVTGRKTQLDDEIVLDYAGECNGEFFEGGTAEKQTLVLGSGMFIPGFEEQLVGKEIGDKVDVTVTFPEVYHAPNLAGKPAVFHCTIHGIRLKSKYQKDDEFAREVGGCDTFEAFRQEMCDALQAYVDRKAEDDLKDNLLTQVCATCDFEVSEEQLSAALDEQIAILEATLGRQGLNLELYCQFTGKSKEELREEYSAEARNSAIREQVINEIAQIENIFADEDSMTEAVAALCRENNVTAEELQPYFDDNFQKAIAKSVVTDKVLQLIRDHAEITVVEK